MVHPRFRAKVEDLQIHNSLGGQCPGTHTQLLLGFSMYFSGIHGD